MSGSLTIGGSATEPAGERIIGPLQIQGNQVVGETLAVPLASGDNTFAIPAGAVLALIIPPQNNSVALKVRTNLNSGDAGLPISPTNPMPYPFPATAPASLIITASGVVTAPLSIVFI